MQCSARRLNKAFLKIRNHKNTQEVVKIKLLTILHSARWAVIALFFFRVKNVDSDRAKYFQATYSEVKNFESIIKMP
jgi:sporulation-control protein spo0M